MARVAEAGEADQHHGPGRRLGNRGDVREPERVPSIPVLLRVVRGGPRLGTRQEPPTGRLNCKIFPGGAVRIKIPNTVLKLLLVMGAKVRLLVYENDTKTADVISVPYT